MGIIGGVVMVMTPCCEIKDSIILSKFHKFVTRKIPHYTVVCFPNISFAFEFITVTTPNKKDLFCWVPESGCYCNIVSGPQN